MNDASKVVNKLWDVRARPHLCPEDMTVLWSVEVQAPAGERYRHPEAFKSAVDAHKLALALRAEEFSVAGWESVIKPCWQREVELRA